MAKKITYWLPALGYMGLIFFLSSQNIQTPYPKFHIDKIIHSIEYFILANLIFFALKNTSAFSTRKIIILSIILSTLYGISDEIHQYFVPGRCSDISDAFADMIGSSFVAISYKYSSEFLTNLFKIGKK